MPAKTQYILFGILLTVALTFIPIGLIFALVSGDWRVLLLAAPGATILHSWLR